MVPRKKTKERNKKIYSNEISSWAGFLPETMLSFRVCVCVCVRVFYFKLKMRYF